MFNHKEVSKNFIICTFLLFLILIAILCFVQFLDYFIVKPIDITSITENDLVHWEIENINNGNHFVAISGYALIEGEKPGEFNLNVVLLNTETKKAYELPTVLVTKEELSEYSSDEIDYSNSGFFSIVNKEIIDYDNYTYEILIKYYNNENRFFIDTNQILSEQLGD